MKERQRNQVHFMFCFERMNVRVLLLTLIFFPVSFGESPIIIINNYGSLSIDGLNLNVINSEENISPCWEEQKFSISESADSSIEETGERSVRQ